MRRDIINWLRENNFELEKLMQKWKLNGSSILEAAEIIYDKVVIRREKIEPIKIGWQLKALAQSIEKGRDAKKVHTLTTALENINELNAQIIVERKTAQDKIAELEQQIITLKYAFIKKTWIRIKKVLGFIKYIIWGD